MKAIFGICLAGVLFWWLFIDRSGRESLYRGTRYAVARITAALGMQKLAKPAAEPPVQADAPQPARPQPARKHRRPRASAPENDGDTEKNAAATSAAPATP